MSPLKEQYLLYKVNAKKDPEAFARLYDLYVRQIYQFIFFRVGRKEDAEDLTANVFLKAWNYLSGSGQEIRNFRAFVYELARHGVADFYRQKGRQETLFFSGEEETISETVVYDFTEKMALSEEKKNILKTLETLKDEYKEVIILRHIEGLSISEIAKIFKKSRITTRVLLHRAMKALRQKLS